MTTNDQDPILDIARGDQAVSKELSSSLKRLREDSGDPRFKSLVDDILTGRKSLREAAYSPTFNQGIGNKIQTGLDWYRGLSEEERESGAEKGRGQLEKIREDLQEQSVKRPNSPTLDLPEDEDNSGYDYGDPLRRNSPDNFHTPQAPRRTFDYQDDEEENCFDPSDPLGRRR